MNLAWASAQHSPPTGRRSAGGVLLRGVVIVVGPVVVRRTEGDLHDVIAGIVFAMSLAQLGWHMALFGLVLGVGFSVFIRPGRRPPRGPTGQGQEDVGRVTANRFSSWASSA